ncbi:ATP-grasp domain-containing protein [Hymenobacter terricola]|uniref:ATP-grasp domain-containing protein n=1 Tax=Hymenobacter terricola TaxID=2819236 RepID=UPI001B312E8F|nr:ATP-grasp domain-containing protein [Hymenobacter terricola]
MLNIILPSLPYQRTVDPMWQEEMDVARSCGYSVCLFDSEQEKLYQQPNPQRPSLYRGWMLSVAEYQNLANMTPLLVSSDMYLASHQATGWYDSISGFTPRSSFVAAGDAEAAVESFMQQTGKCFIKGLTKSFGPESVIASRTEFDVLWQKHEVAPPDLLFVREFVGLSSQAEQRFFVVRNEAFGAAETPFPEVLRPALEALKSRWFYTVDIAYTQTGQPIIIEVGDGQVSDIKEWSVAELYGRVISRLSELATA